MFGKPKIIKKIRKLRLFSLQEQAPSSTVKNRRLAKMTRLAKEGYFDDDAARLRAPLLHYQYIGQHTANSQPKSRYCTNDMQLGSLWSLIHEILTSKHRILAMSLHDKGMVKTRVGVTENVMGIVELLTSECNTNQTRMSMY